MTQARSSAEVDAFIAWLSQVLRAAGVTRAQLAQHLGPGGVKRIDNDLSCAYLPAWPYVVSTYLGPIEEITQSPLAAAAIAEGKWLYDAAELVAVPYVPRDGGDESFSRVVAPVLAGFSLPAIASLATSTTPGQPWRDIALSCFITATGSFLASFQLTIGSVYIRFYDSGKNIRAGLSFTGIGFLMAALIVLVAAAAEHWWVVIALTVLGLGASSPILLRGWLKLLGSRRSSR